ncbi:MAG TPA: hypothetical protein PKE19_06340 [Aestuariivirga sp.]|nr:hypothetical protein [Aestuariivirga sp.]
MDYLNRHAPALQALAAILTVILALAALVGVKMQIDAADRIQRAQSARDIYREFLNLSIGKPEFLAPDYCAIAKTPQAPAYEAYVDYLLYTAEQTMAADAGWEETMMAALDHHGTYLCGLDDGADETADVQDLLAKFRAARCAEVKRCSP